MGWSVSNDQPDVAPELGTLDPVFRLSGRHSQSDLHHQRGGVAEYVATQGDQDPGIVSQFGSRYETAVPGPGAHRQEMDHAGAELEGRFAAFRDSARRPCSENGVGLNRHSMNNRKKNISGTGALPPNPRDLSLLRQDCWSGRRASLALPESRPLSRRSGCVSAEPYPTPRSVQSSRNEELEKHGRLHKKLDAPVPCAKSEGLESSALFPNNTVQTSDRYSQPLCSSYSYYSLCSVLVFWYL